MEYAVIIWILFFGVGTLGSLVSLNDLEEIEKP